MTLEEMLALLADNTTGDISAEDMRAIVTALYELFPEGTYSDITSEDQALRVYKPATLFEAFFAALRMTISGNVLVLEGPGFPPLATVQVPGSESLPGRVRLGTGFGSSISVDLIANNRDLEVDVYNQSLGATSLILRSPNGDRWRISVDDSGVVSASAV